jgi:hypothetical protein
MTRILAAALAVSMLAGAVSAQPWHHHHRHCWYRHHHRICR